MAVMQQPLANMRANKPRSTCDQKIQFGGRHVKYSVDAVGFAPGNDRGAWAILAEMNR